MVPTNSPEQEARGMPVGVLKTKPLLVASAQSWPKLAQLVTVEKETGTRGFRWNISGPFSGLIMLQLSVFMLHSIFLMMKPMKHKRKRIFHFRIMGILKFRAWLTYLSSELPMW